MKNNGRKMSKQHFFCLETNSNKLFESLTNLELFDRYVLVERTNFGARRWTMSLATKKIDGETNQQDWTAERVSGNLIAR